MMKSVLLVVLLAAAATAAVVSNDVRNVVELPAEADVDVDEVPQVVVTDVLELTDLTEVADAAEDTVVATRRNLSSGTFKDTRVYNVIHIMGSVAGYHVVKEISATTNGKFTGIRVTRVGDSHTATPSIEKGGVGKSSVAIRITSAASRGFSYRVELYAK